MKPVIDADAHVIENERTWEFMDETEKEFAPDPVESGKTGLMFWRIDDRVFPNTNIGLNTSENSRELSDVGARILHMDKLQVDIQVIYPTLFLRPLTTRAEVESALCRGYNRWLADIFRQGQGRIRWIVLAPVRNMERSIEEINFGKSNGACGVFLHGHEGDRLLSDSSLFPLYKEASRLNLPICIHAGTGNMNYYDLYGQDVFSRFKLPAVGAFNNLVYKGVPSRFPDLRWCFVEISSQWIPYAINDLVIRTESEMAFRKKYSANTLASVRGNPRKMKGRDLLEENNIYVACQTTDDLQYVLQCAGENNIIVGTDYGHADYSNDIEAVSKLGESGSISAIVADKILRTNPSELYGL